MGAPGTYLQLCRGARVAAAQAADDAGQDGAGDDGTRKHDPNITERRGP